MIGAMDIRKSLVVDKPVDLLKLRPDQFATLEIPLQLPYVRDNFKQNNEHTILLCNSPRMNVGLLLAGHFQFLACRFCAPQGAKTTHNNEKYHNACRIFRPTLRSPSKH